MSIQTAFMMERTLDIETCMQNDSVYGFINDMSHGEVNVTFTSAYCPVIQNTMPLVISIIFETAIQTYYNIGEDESINLDHHYCFYGVHYKRSVTRVRINTSIIPQEKEFEFYKAALELPKRQLSKETFEALASDMCRNFPRAKNWLSWYLHPSRGKHIFSSLGESSLLGLSKNTNAQESLGKLFQYSAEGDTLSAGQAYKHVYRFITRFEYDYKAAKLGVTLQYGAPPTAKRMREP
ncbi:hypothetical protein EDD21DRAFT_440617 [Dissophora ornata]|nr:hypothetical protein EDD21DRAFT_440617 [Dissophora ornata]